MSILSIERNGNEEVKVYEFEKTIDDIDNVFTYMVDKNTMICYNKNKRKYIIHFDKSLRLNREMLYDIMDEKSFPCKQQINVYKKYFEDKCGFEILRYTVKYIFNKK